MVVSRGDQRIKTLGLIEDAGYWRDVGTLDSYWQANLDLVAVKPPFSLYGERWPIFRSPTFFPPAKFVHEEERPHRHGGALHRRRRGGHLRRAGAPAAWWGPAPSCRATPWWRPR